MKIIQQLIKEKLEKFDEDLANGKENFYDFYQIFNLALAVRQKKTNIKKRNSLYKEHLRGKKKATTRLRKLIYSDRAFIYSLLKSIETEQQKKGVTGDFYKKGRFAISHKDYDRKRRAN